MSLIYKPITLSGTKGIIADNSILYLEFIRSSAQHADPECNITASVQENRIDVRVMPSESNWKQVIIDNILGVHRILNMRIRFSKSLGLQNSIHYNLFFEE